MVATSGRKPRSAKTQIIQAYREGKSTSEIIAKLGYTAQKDKDYVYHVITEARGLGITPKGAGTPPALPAPAPSSEAGSSLVIEEAPVVEEAGEVSSMYGKQDEQKPAPAVTAAEIPSEPAVDAQVQQEEEGTEIDLSDIVELPIDIEDRIFRRRGMEALTEQEKGNIRNHGKVMLEKRIKIKHKYGDVINYVKAFLKPVMVRVVGKKFTKDIEQTEGEKSDAMAEYERLASKKGENQ